MPRSRIPAEVFRSLNAVHGRSRFRDNGSLPAMRWISELYDAAFVLAVYASHPLSPRRMQDSLPVARYALPGGVRGLSTPRPPLGHFERFLLIPPFTSFVTQPSLRSPPRLKPGPVFSATPPPGCPPTASPFLNGAPRAGTRPYKPKYADACIILHTLA